MTAFRSLAAAAAAALALLAGAAQANTSGTIQLRGTVAAVCTVAVTDLNAALSLTGGESNKTVGTVVETCNSGAGYNISISSANQGQLKASGGGNPAVAYTVNYDGSSGTLGSAMTVGRSTAQFGKQASLGITVPANANALAGTYSDTVTITIAAK